MLRIVARLLVVFISSPLLGQTRTPATGSSSHAKVRAITAFVHIDRPQYHQQIAGALAVLRKLKTEFEADAYAVETIRVTTQPLSELVAGLSEEDALKFLGELDEFSAKEDFLLNVGPAMMHDSDDPASILLLERALSTLPHINSSTIIAADDGIHWKSIRLTAELVKYVSEHSPHAQGTFNFTASAMLKPLGPFFPGSYHTGAGRQFAIGFEGAGVVQEVF